MRRPRSSSDRRWWGGQTGKPFAFLKHNQALAAKVADLENRLRRRDLLVERRGLRGVLPETRLRTCTTSARSVRLIKTRGGDGFLLMSEDDLLNYRPDEGELGLFPERLRRRGIA